MNPSAEELRARYELREVKVVEAEPQIHAARFSPCGKFLLAGGYDSAVRRWAADQPGLPELPPLGGHQGWVQALAFSADGQTVFTGDSWGALQARSLADPDAAPRWKHDQAHASWLRQLSVSPDGQQLASCGLDETLRIWNPADGQRLREIPAGDDVFCLLYHPTEPWLVSGDQHGRIRQWDPGDGQCVRELDASVLYQYHRLQEVGGVRTLAFSNDGRWLAAGGTQPKNGGSVTGIPLLLVFDWQTGELAHKLELGTTNDVYVCDAILHADGFAMAVTSGQPGAGKLVFQRPEDKEPFQVHTKLANCHALSLDPTGKRLAVTATNRGSNGNGRQLTADGKYPGNKSPIHLFELAAG